MDLGGFPKRFFIVDRGPAQGVKVGIFVDKCFCFVFGYTGYFLL